MLYTREETSILFAEAGFPKTYTITGGPPRNEQANCSSHIPVPAFSPLVRSTRSLGPVPVVQYHVSGTLCLAWYCTLWEKAAVLIHIGPATSRRPLPVGISDLSSHTSRGLSLSHLTNRDARRCY